MHPHDFGVEELIVGDGLLLEVKLEGEDGRKLLGHRQYMGSQNPGWQR